VEKRFGCNSPSSYDYLLVCSVASIPVHRVLGLDGDFTRSGIVFGVLHLDAGEFPV
jgi:hypothetical protein